VTDESILVVCTANRCRSPLADFWLTDRVAGRGLPWTVASAGVAARTGDVVEADVVSALAEIGVVATQRPVRRLDAGTASGAGLVLTAERAHRSAVLRAAPALVGRVFTLLEFERLVRTAWSGPGWRTPAHVTDLALLADGARSRAGRSGSDDDLADPLGGGPDAFRACRDTVIRALDPLLASFPG
jgi:protein-tyrosine phosphatase